MPPLSSRVFQPHMHCCLPPDGTTLALSLSPINCPPLTVAQPFLRCTVPHPVGDWSSASMVPRAESPAAASLGCSGLRHTYLLLPPLCGPRLCDLVRTTWLTPLLFATVFDHEPPLRKAYRTKCFHLSVAFGSSKDFETCWKTLLFS